MNARRRPNGAELRLVQPPPDPSGKAPPHDLAAEAVTLSDAILDREALQRVLDILKPEHFYSRPNSRIMQALVALHAAGTPVDAALVASWLHDRQWLSECGGSAYIGQLVDATPAVGNVGAHAKRVYELWRRREIIARADRIRCEGYGDVGEMQAWCDAAERSLVEITRAEGSADLDRFAIGAIANESIQETIALQNPIPGAFISTGVKPIDDVTGLYQNEVTLLGAPKGLGKTTLARHIADRMARNPRRLIDGRPDCDKCKSEEPCCELHSRQPRGVLVFQLEGTRRDWSDYSAAKAAGLNLFDRRNAKWSTEETSMFMGEAERLRRLPIAVDDRKDLCRANLGARVRAWRDWFARKGAALELIVLDYFQIGAWERGGDTRESDLSDAGRHLIRLATDAESDLRGHAWLVISALNKDGGTRESGALEYHCDTFWRLSETKGDTSYGKPLRLWIEKQRRVPSKLGVPFWFDQQHGNFFG